MKFTTTKTYELIARYPDGLQASLSALDEPIQHAALRAIAKHLGAETVREVLLDSLPDDALEPIARELFGRLSEDACERLSTFFFADVDPLDSASLRELRNAFESELGWSSEVAEEEGDYLGRVGEIGSALRECWKELDTARAQLADVKAANRRLGAALREWRDTVGKPLQQGRWGIVEKTVDRLLSATPDEGGSEPMVPASEVAATSEAVFRLLARTNEMTGEHWAQDGNPRNTLVALERRFDDLVQERDVALKRVGEMEAELEKARAAGNRRTAELTRERDAAEQRATRAEDKARREAADADKMLRKLRRAETAVEAMRDPVIHAIRAGYADGTHVLRYREDKITQALADYDANKPAAPLSQAEVDALPEGTPVIVTWSGGSGPHRYTIGVLEDGRRYALLPFDGVPDIERVLKGVGPFPSTQVWIEEVASANKPAEPTDEQPQARGGGKCKWLKLVCAESPHVQSTTGGRVSSIYLDRRRLRDWLTAWLGDPQ